MLERFEEKYIPEPNSGCWLWFGAFLSEKNPYGFISDEDGVLTRAHRIAWRLFRYDIPDGKFVLHRCDMPCCVNPDHLFIGTQADNVADCIRKGRARYYRTGKNNRLPLESRVVGVRKGSDHRFARLTESSVIEIRASPEHSRVVAACYGVSLSTIADIRARKTWKHI